MHIRYILLCLVAALTLAIGGGCQKSEPSGPTAPAAPSALSVDTVARVHWLGKKRLGIKAGAYYFMRLWGFRESAQIEAQTLDKLALAPWRLLRGDPALTDPASALLRPLLNDLVQEEVYFEVRQATNQPAQLVFAIRLDEQRAESWRTNLAVVMESLTGVRPVTSPVDRRGWSLNQTNTTRFIELGRVREWTVVGATQEKNALLGEIVARIQRDRAPFFAQATNDWLEADVNLERTAGALGLDWKLPDELPRISIAVTGDGGNVLTRGELTLTKPLELESWTIPTNLVREPLASFTAVRGIKPWLASWKTWNDIQIGPPPGQLHFWALQDVPYHTFFAAPLPDASNRVHQFTEHLMEKVNPWLASNGYVSFERSADSNGATWGKVPSVMPFIKSVGVGPGAMIFGGLLPNTGADTNRTLSAELIQDILQRTNLVYYDWEITGQRIEACFHLGQFFRQISRHAPLPLESASAALLGQLALRLTSCATVVTYTGANQLSFNRKSTTGFTAAELHLLADWLESPRFPRGSQTFLAPSDAPPAGGPPPTAAPRKP